MTTGTEQKTELIPLTQKQLRLYQRIAKYRREYGVSPTLKELAAMEGVAIGTIFDHLRALEDKGLIERTARHGARAIIIKPGAAEALGLDVCPACGRGFDKDQGDATDGVARKNGGKDAAFP